MTQDWSRLGKGKQAKCFCGKTDRLIPYCGFYICVWCRTGQKHVRRLARFNTLLRKKVSV